MATTFLRGIEVLEALAGMRQPASLRAVAGGRGSRSRRRSGSCGNWSKAATWSTWAGAATGWAAGRWRCRR